MAWFLVKFLLKNLAIFFAFRLIKDVVATMNVRFRLTAACLSVVAVFLLSGCNAASEESQVVSGEVVLNVPDSNPYKSDITQKFNEIKSPFAQKVLADGVVTDAELAEGQALYMSCLEKVGLKATITKTTGEFAVEIGPIDGLPDDMNERDKNIAECDSSTAYFEIEVTHGRVISNPDNKNPVEMMLKCLKKRGVVEAGVTLKGFDPMYEDWDYMDAHRKDFDECYADPNFYQG